jgi:hypothetical protein
MRVAIVERIPKREGGGTVISPDGATNLAMKNFLAAIESEDSLLSLVQPLREPRAAEEGSARMHSSELILEFRQGEHAREKRLHFLLVEKLAELLKQAGSQETLEATICLTAASQENPEQKGLALWIGLEAKGETTEQAALRWSLGLTHIQQALLFTLRHLRMYLAQTAG